MKCIKQLLYIVVCIIFTSTIHSKNKIKVVGTEESKKSFISYITMNGTIYLIKQKKNKDHIVLSVVKDALAAWIAKDLNIAHLVTVIPDIDNIPGKQIKDFPATLHTIAPGCVIKHLSNNRFSRLKLKQFIPDEPKPSKEVGLTKSIITQMTWHKQIPIIIALDLFIGNWGRHNGNFFYDKKKNSFCVIDMDHAFEREIGSLAYNNLLKMMQESVIFTKQEKHALRNMLATLKFLLQRYPAHKIKKKLKNFINETGFSVGKEIYSEQVSQTLNEMNLMIDLNEKYIRKIIILLHKIVNVSDRKYSHKK